MGKKEILNTCQPSNYI